MTNLVLAIYIIVLSFLVLLGLRAFWLLYLFIKHKNRWRVPSPPPPREWPRVLVQIPLYNEALVAERVIRAAASMDYPKQKLHIQVLDDSDDETVAIVARVVEELRREGVKVEHLRRGSRRGYKAGALAWGMGRTNEPYIAIFDADFIPPRDFLTRTIPHLVANPKLAVVQARWGYVNAFGSPITPIQSVLLDGHFVVEQFVRSRAGMCPIFNGTAGVWRREAILRAGGWDPSTLAEDADLSYRAQMLGYEILYLPDLVAPSELPEDINAFKSQQYRWTKGGVQVMRKLLGKMWKSPLPLRAKLEATAHLVGNLAYPAMLVLGILTLPVLTVKNLSEAYHLYFTVAGFFIVGAMGFPALYWVALRHAYSDWRRRLAYVPFLVSLTMALAVNNTAAALEGLFKSGGVFERTPKFGNANAELRAKYRKRHKLVFSLLELGLGVYLTITYIYAVVSLQLVIVPFLALYALGSLIMGYMSYVANAPKAKPEEVLEK